MAHEITLLDQVVTETGTERAWHQLDSQRDLGGLSNEDLAARTGLDFGVSVVPLGRIDNRQPIEGMYGVFSSHNPEMMTQVGDHALLVQPCEVAALANEIAAALDGRIVSAGTIKGTRLGFISLDLGKKIELPGEDTIKQHLTVTISYDGSYRFSVASMDYRTVCNNTYPSPDCLTLWEGAKIHGFQALPVDRGFDPAKVGKMVADAYISRIAANRQKYQDVIGSLVTTHFDGARDRNLLRFASVMADGREVLKRIVQIEESSTGSYLDKCLAATIDNDAWNSVRTSNLSNVGTRIVAETLDGLGADMESASGTLWGMLNGYTSWTDHHSGNSGGRGRQTTAESRQEDVLFGNFSDSKQNSMLLLSAIANTPSVR